MGKYSSEYRNLSKFLDYWDIDAKITIHYFLLNSPPQVESCRLNSMQKVKLLVLESYEFETEIWNF